MKLVYICDSIIPSRSANSIHVMKMCQAFAQNGHKVTLIAPYLKSLQEPDIRDLYTYYNVERCFQLYRIPCMNIYGRPLIFGLFQIPFFLLKYKPEIVYGRSVFGCFSSSILGIPTIFESHAPIFYELRITQWFQRRLFDNPNFVKLVVISNALKKMYQKMLPTKQINILVAHDGADLPDKLGILSNWPGRKEALQVGYVGHLYQGRGIELIFELAKQMSDIDFHLMGGTRDDIHFWKCQNHLANLFVHGFILPGRVAKYRTKCDILLAPYQEQCAVSGGKGNTSEFMSPLKIFEYMSSEKAIIASNLPVLWEVLNKTNAMLVPPDNSHAWYQAIGRLKDRKIRKQISGSAYCDFVNKFTWKKRAQKVLE
jgi:glycosyltransferase involved in cell wall biosynthesis